MEDSMTQDSKPRPMLEIRNEMEEFYDKVMSVDGQTLETDEFQTMLQKWRESLEWEARNKIDSMSAVIRNLEGQAHLRNVEAKRIAELAKSDSNKAARLKQFMKESMDHLGMAKCETDRFRVSVCNNGGQLPIELTGKVPPEYQTITEVRENNTELIRHKLESGESLDFAVIKPRGTHIRIR
jgi:hypothetical protein